MHATNRVVPRRPAALRARSAGAALKSPDASASGSKTASSLRLFDTPCGRMGVIATARGLVRVLLPNESNRCDGGSPNMIPRQCRGLPRVERDPKSDAYAARAEREIREYLAGRRRKFTVPIDTSALPPFHKKVLLAAGKIPFGRTETYAALAARVGSPRGARAVGQAMARNPLPLVLPCHRVVATGGGLGGYGGGLDLKRRLHAIEGAKTRRRRTWPASPGVFTGG